MILGFYFGFSGRFNILKNDTTEIKKIIKYANIKNVSLSNKTEEF